MILVVSPNLALDRVVVVRFRPRATLRASRFFVWPGGSGVHAAHVARVLGSEAAVFGFAGGDTGQRVHSLLLEHSLEPVLFPALGETRQTLSLLDEKDGNVCDIVEPSPWVADDATSALEGAVIQRLGEASIVIISGSLPKGCPADLPAHLVSAARVRGVRTVADLDGEVLEIAIHHGPWMIKPSLEEIEGTMGRVDAAGLLAVIGSWIHAGVENVCVSLGARGLLWVSAAAMFHIRSPRVPPYNSIGSGDTLVGAVAAWLDRGASLKEALTIGVAAAAVNLRHEEPGHCEIEEVEALREAALLVELSKRSEVDAILAGAFCNS